MFTIIICDNQIIEECKVKFNSFLRPLKNDEYEFLPWNVKGKMLSDSVPGLQDIVKKNKEWRAIIVNTKETSDMKMLNCRNGNPFDLFSQQPMDVRDYETPEEAYEYAEQTKSVFEKIASNPLIRLNNWLMGPNIIDYEDPKNFYLTSGLDMKKLSQDEEQMKASRRKLHLLRDKEEIIEELKKEIDYYGYRTDAGLNEVGKNLLDEVVVKIKRYYRDDTLKNVFLSNATTYDFYVESIPKEIIILSERAILGKDSYYEMDLVDKDECQNFVENNLYPLNVRFLLYDVKYGRDGIRKEKNRLRFCTLVNALAAYDHPNDALKPGRVYKVEISLNEDKLKAQCDDYVSKLLATKNHLERLMHVETMQQKKQIDNEVVDDLFSRNEYVECNTELYDEDTLFCTYDDIGLAKDCPSNEESNWSNQYESIKKSFARYMLEPKRSIRKAAEGEMREKSIFYDERAFDLNEIQKENLEYKLYERMDLLADINVDTVIDTDKYYQQMDERSDRINEVISHRMNRNTTVLSGVILMGLFFVGCIPFIMSSFLDQTGGMLSLIISLIALGIFMVVLFAAIVYFRYLLVNELKGFNSTVKSILKKIDDSLDLASEYLSRSCEVMKLNYILSLIGQEKNHNYKTLEKHEKDIERAIKAAYEGFDEYLTPLNRIHVRNLEDIFEHDYLREQDYTYSMGDADGNSTIEFLQFGNDISVPLNFIGDITLDLEENYGQYY